MKNTKANLTVKEILELVLAAAGIFILIWLLVVLISPIFDKDKETTKSYFNTLEKQIKIVDSGGKGNFEIWQGDNIYLVYFGKKIRVNFEDKEFFLENFHENYICVCYSKNKKENFCEYCKSLDKPAFLDSWGYDGWAKKKGDQLLIDKDKEKYIFKKIW